MVSRPNLVVRGVSRVEERNAGGKAAKRGGLIKGQ